MKNAADSVGAFAGDLIQLAVNLFALGVIIAIIVIAIGMIVVAIGAAFGKIDLSK